MMLELSAAKSLIDTALLAGIFWRMGGFSVRLDIIEKIVLKGKQHGHA